MVTSTAPRISRNTAAQASQAPLRPAGTTRGSSRAPAAGETTGAEVAGAASLGGSSRGASKRGSGGTTVVAAGVAASAGPPTAAATGAVPAAETAAASPSLDGVKCQRLPQLAQRTLRPSAPIAASSRRYRVWQAGQVRIMLCSTGKRPSRGEAKRIGPDDPGFPVA